MEEIENNLRTSLKSKGGKDESKGIVIPEKGGRRDKYLEYSSDEDEYFDRAKDPNIWKSSEGRASTQSADKKRGVETYETLKQKLESMITKRKGLYTELTDISKGSTQSEHVDPLEEFMTENEGQLAEERKSKVLRELSRIAADMEECKAMLILATPTYVKTPSHPVGENVLNIPSVPVSVPISVPSEATPTPTPTPTPPKRRKAPQKDSIWEALKHIQHMREEENTRGREAT